MKIPHGARCDGGALRPLTSRARTAWFLLVPAQMLSRTEVPQMSQQPHGVRTWLDLIQAEYRELPTLCLSKAQMQRLWGLDAAVCDALIAALVDARVLRRTPRDTYVSWAGRV